MKIFGAMAAIGLLMSDVSYAATSDQCFTDDQFADLLTVMGPTLLQTMTQQCAAILPKGAVLGNPDDETAKKLEAASVEAWPRALPNIVHVFVKDPALMPVAAALFTRQQFEAKLAPMMANVISKPANCASADKILKLVEPLPAKNLFQLLVALVRVAPQNGKRTEFLCDQP